MFGELGLALLALGLVVFNGFLVLAEFAIVKVRATRLEELAEQGDLNAKVAREILARLDAYLSATQLGITLASLALGWVGEPAFAGLIDRVIDIPGWLSSAASHGISMALAFLLITFLHIVVGELAPRFVAIRHAEAATLFVARPLQVFGRVFAIPLAVVHGAARFVLRLFGIEAVSEVEVTYSEEEFRSILGASQERGGFSFHHLLLLENAFDFGNLRLKDVEVPLDRVTFLDAHAPWSENAAVIAEKRLSRYPLRDGPRGKILGFVHVKTVLVDLLAGRTPDVRREVIRLPRVSGEVLLEVALRKLQKSGEHMGIVTDPTGADVAMFTLEDIVEELIGDIHDEFEPTSAVSITDLLPADAVVLDPLVVDRTELVNVLVRLSGQSVEGFDAAAAAETVMKREKAVPFSIAGSVAVPHSRVTGLKEPRAAFARLREGIEWQAPDGRPVRLVLLLLIPADAAPGVQARYLQKVGGLMQSDYLRDRLLGAETAEEVREIFRIGETSS